MGPEGRKDGVDCPDCLGGDADRLNVPPLWTVGGSAAPGADMGRRRSKARKRKGRAGGGNAASGVNRIAGQPAAAPSDRGTPEVPTPPGEAPAGSALRPWRTRVQDLLEHLRAWSREHYGAAIEAWLEQRLGTSEEGDRPAAVNPADADQALEEFVCAPGSAGEGRSVLGVFADQAPGPDGGPMDPEDREQARRWERERARGVFLIQHAARDRLTLWDPLEGAPLTLHLLHRLSEARLGHLRRGTVVTATYQPWMARLVAVGEIEYFSDPRAIALFREQSVESGTRWYEAPPAAPRSASKGRR